MEESTPVRVCDCHRCPSLVDSRSQIVNGTGAEDAALMIVGEAPGAEEDRLGEPFVGRSGDLLTETLDRHGIDRSAIRITNCVRCRPPDNRNPRVDELDNCREYLEVEIEAVDPTLIMTVGKVPSSTLLGRSVRVTAEAGSIHRRHIGPTERQVLVSLHPAAILYDRTQSDRFDETIATAAAYIGASPDGADQTNLTEFGDGAER